ncbi:AAA family ATPase [Ectothiorhodospira haloalkaliphila]|uniref:ATP-binding protein n=1 Tax=Ectothiorhodospira haloalkaliphila TaxID=421628 RepID=UPI001EE868B0|nr:YhaN family protein [Ectothiorhodospira haloalkaliphila]MCG5524647.1 AAA family ATPase [Ectothiorhodospira haloalkaliphila]
MKLIRLDLQAFGPFTDTQIVFGQADDGRDADGLHLIYGPNEAGKSSALRAMTDLRFGIPVRSRDNFVHDFNRLRIAGVFVDARGEPVYLARRKGRGLTLHRPDSKDHTLTDAPAATPEQEQQLTGGLTREAFEAMFGLDHLRLREGGDRLLKGEGELGSALFEASAGTRGIAGILEALDTDAKGLFSSHGRATQAVINEARSTLEGQRKVHRDALTRPAEWQALERSHQQALEELTTLEKTLEEAQRHEKDLAGLRTVAPLLEDLDRLRKELASLDTVPDLAAEAREQRLSAQQARGRARQDLRDAEAQWQECELRLRALVIETPLLEHAATIERLAGRLETVTEARVELYRQQARVERLDARLAEQAQRLDHKADVQKLLKHLPSAADRAALEEDLNQLAVIGPRLEDRRSRLEALETAEREAEHEAAAPEVTASESLAQALHQARALGEVTTDTQAVKRDLEDMHGQLQQHLADMGQTELQAVREARPLMQAQLDEARNARDAVEDTLRALNEEQSRLQRDRQEQARQLEQLTAGGRVVTLDTLLEARAWRDALWSRLRQTYVEGKGAPETAMQDLELTRPLPESFEAAQVQADHQADQLRENAGQAARIQECQGRIKAMDERHGEIQARLAQGQREREAWIEHWQARLQAQGLPDLSPDALGQWQARREALLELARRVERLERSQAERDEQRRQAMEALSQALCAVGERPAGTDLATLIEQAGAWERQATAAQGRRQERERHARIRQRDRDALVRDIDAMERSWQARTRAVSAWHERLGLPATAGPATVRARLEELDALEALSVEREDLLAAQARQQSLVRDFQDQVASLAHLLGEPAPSSPDDHAGQLQMRLRVAREREHQRAMGLQEQGAAATARERARQELDTQARVLEALCQAAGGVCEDDLPEIEARADRKRQVRMGLEERQQQLALASIRSEADLRQRLEGLDVIAIEADQARCQGEIERLGQAVAEARRVEERTRRELEAVDTSGEAARAREAMESAAARIQGAIRPWLRLRLAHGLLQEALHRFRQRSQAPMVAAASKYLALMTQGRYARLEADESQDVPVLKATRDDGTLIGVDAMSEGTRDQLYLALRLAALELRRESHPGMPVILDDVLMTSDDARAGLILQALARFAGEGQVMLFTHHRHLLEVAREAVQADALHIHELERERGVA